MYYLTNYQENEFHQAVPFEQRFLPDVLQKKRALCEIEIQKAAILSEIRYQSEVRKELLKEEASERRRQVYEQLCVAEDGGLQFITQNLSIDSKPRLICNAKNFHLTNLLDSENNNNQIAMIWCEIDGREKFFYLDPKKLGKASYVLQKMTSSGIQIKLPETKMKSFAKQFITWLLNQPSRNFVVPHTTGWVQMSTAPDSFIYIEKEDTFVWEIIVTQI